ALSSVVRLGHYEMCRYVDALKSDGRRVADQWRGDPSARDPVFVLRQPLIEGQEVWVQRASHFRNASAYDLLLEITVHLKHVAHCVGAREAEAAISVRVDGVVLDRTDAEGA